MMPDGFDIASRAVSLRELIVLLACLCPLPSLAAPDVCPSGCEYDTITEAVDSKPGGTVIIGAGVYTETNIHLGSPLKANVLTSESPNDPTLVVIDGGGAGPVIIGPGEIIGITRS